MVWMIVAMLIVAGVFFFTSNSKAAPQQLANVDAGNAASVVYYWRPGCPFCMRLERGLTRAGIAMDKRNIWEDAEHAATVRGYADGNETVPTVIIGSIALVNPSVKQVKETVANQLGG